MQALSFRALGATFYDSEAIEAFLAHVGTMDDVMFDDGTYFVATSLRDGRIVGSGGWSWRAPTYTARMTDRGNPATAMTAAVRSIYVHPAFARRGIARAMMETIEAEIAVAGYTSASLTTPLSGIPLYRNLGYRSGHAVTLSLPNDLAFVCLGMDKAITWEMSDYSQAA
jgi:GNAT superfamily N-acetyltransferase